MSKTYHPGHGSREIDIIDIKQLAKKASKLLPKGGWDYLNGGAGDEWTLRQNTAAFHHRQLVPRVLASLEKPELKTSLLGVALSQPLIMAPVAAQGLAHITAESGSAKGVAAAGSLMCVSTYSTQTAAEIARAGQGAPQWFQFYPSKDEGFNRHLLDQAKANGYKAIVLTADATVGGNREADRKNRFVFPLPLGNLAAYGKGQGQSMAEIYAQALQKIGPENIEKIASRTGLPVVVKGIQSPDDALLAIRSGAAAVYVSNHGGRQLDGGPASFDVLPSIAEAVDKKVPVVFDSGVRRGQHVFEALACGADVVAIGRPAIYGLAVGGWKGVKSVFDYFARELETVMQLAGTKTVEDIRKASLLRVDFPCCPQ